MNKKRAKFTGTNCEVNDSIYESPVTSRKDNDPDWEENTSKST